MQLLPVEIRTETQGLLDENITSMTHMQVQVTDVRSRQKDHIVVATKHLSSIRKHLDNEEEAACVSKLERWLMKGKNKPSSTDITKALSACLCCISSRNGFKASFDPAILSKYRKLFRKEKSNSEKLVPHQIPTSDSEDEDLNSKWEADQEMKQANKRISASLNKSQEITYAECAARSSQASLKARENELEEQRIVVQAYQQTARKTTTDLRCEMDVQKDQNRQYKSLINDALQTMDYCDKTEAKMKRDKVKHVRELNRLKTSSFPFQNSGKWKKGPMLGPGPHPVRNVAILKGQQQVQAPSTKVSRKPNLSQTERLVMAFEALRELAKTADQHYLDFETGFRTLDRHSRGFCSKRDLESFLHRKMILYQIDIDILWEHFDGDGNGFMDKDQLVWGFYNKRRLLNLMRKNEEHVSFQVLKEIEVPLEQLPLYESHEPSSFCISVKSVKGVKGLSALDHAIFCVISVCEIVPGDEDQEDTIVIFEEKRTLNSNLRQDNRTLECFFEDEDLLFRKDSYEKRLNQHLLIEIRALEDGAASDVRSIFVGEIFMSFADLFSTTAHGEQWLSLQHGDFEGKILIRLVLDQPVVQTKTPKKNAITRTKNSKEAKMLIDELIGSHGVSTLHYDKQARNTIDDLIGYVK